MKPLYKNLISKNQRTNTIQSRLLNAIVGIDTHEFSILGLNLGFSEKKVEVAFKEHERQNIIRQTVAIITTIGCLNFWIFILLRKENSVNYWNCSLLATSVVSFLICLVLSLRKPRVLRDKVRAQFHNILLGLFVYYFFSHLWHNFFKELLQDYELRCEAMQFQCPNSFWNVPQSCQLMGLLMVGNNCVGLQFRQAAYLNLAVLVALLPTLVPWYEKTDSQGRTFTVNNVDSSILIGFSMTVLYVAITLRRCFINETLHRLQYKQLHELNILRRVKMVLMDSMLPSRFQNPALTSMPSTSSPSPKQSDCPESFHPAVVEEFPHVTVLICRFREEDMNQFEDPDEFVHTVARCVTAFDQMVQASHMFKVEHVGETYVVSSPEISHGPDSTQQSTQEDRRRSAVALVRLAEEFVKVGCRVSSRCGHSLGFSAAVNSGSALGGILGQTRRFYRLMGETVQTTAKMARMCPAGQVVVSANTKTLLEGARFILVESRLDSLLGRENSSLKAEFSEHETKEPNESGTVVYYLSDVCGQEELFVEDAFLEDCQLTESGLSGSEKDLVGNEWIWHLYAEASGTLNYFTARFKVDRIEALYKHETRHEIRRSTANNIYWLIVSHFVYFVAMLSSMIYSGSKRDILFGTASAGFCTLCMFSGIRISMVWDQRDHWLSVYNWLMNSVCLFSILTHAKLCPSHFSFSQSSLLLTLMYNQEDFVTFIVFLVVYTICYIPLYASEHSNITESSSFAGFLAISSVARVVILSIVCRELSLLKRVKWTLEDLLKRRHSELNSLLVDLIPSSRAREFMIEQQLPCVDLSLNSFNACCIWMSQTRVQAVILSTQVTDFFTISAIIGPVQTAFWLHDIWSLLDIYIEEHKQENKLRKDENDEEDIVSECPFKLGIVEQSYVVVGLATSSSEKSLVCVARKMLQLASQISQVAGNPLLHEYTDCDVPSDMRLGLTHGEVTLAAVGEIQPRLQVYDEVMSLAFQMEKQSQPGFITLSEDLATLLQFHTRSFPVHELLATESQCFDRSENLKLHGEN